MRVFAWSCVVWCACSSPAKVVAPLPVVPVKVSDPAPPALRTSGDVVPTKYALDLTIIPSAPTASGTVTIAMKVLAPTRVVWLNATELTIASATIDGAAARVVAGNEDFVGFTIERDLPLGPHTLVVAYSGRIDKDASRGLYSAREPGEGEDNDYAYTFFEPIDARRAFPCFDEPSAKVPWQLTFHVKEGHVALGNAPVVKETPEGDGMKRVELAETPPLPSYLVAYIVGPFELVDGGSAGRVPTPIRFAIPKGRSGELGYAKRVTPKIVKALEDYFAMDYPYKKLDVAVVPRYWGTMEHPGIVAMGQPLTLIRPEQEVRARTYQYANILAHELGHYWFGDYVTMAWWDDTWLNESLGQWLDLVITDAAEPTFKAFDSRVGFADYAMRSDETLETRAIRKPVTTRDAIQGSFDNAVTYSKGSSVLRMFEAAVGKDKWRTAMQTYLAAHAWGTATSNDLLASLATSLGAPTAAAMRTFLDQPGVPRVTGDLSCAPNAAPVLELTQKRSLPVGVSDPSGAVWSVPVCVRFGGATSKRVCTRLDGAVGRLTLGKPGDACPTWVLLNASADGYYRSVLEPALAKQWFAPGKVRTSARPSVAEKMMLVADLAAMGQREELPIDQQLALAPVIAADADERVANGAQQLANIPTEMLDAPMVERAHRYQARTFGALATKLGWTRARSDSQERHELRAALLMRVGEYDPALTKKAAVLAEKWLADRSGLDDELVAPALYVATSRGTAAWFDKLVAAAHAARDRDEQGRILAALGWFRDPALLARALEIVRGADFDLRESSVILYAALYEPTTRAAARTFAVEQLADLLVRMRDDEAGWILEAVASTACAPAALAQVTALTTPLAKKYAGSEVAVARGLEKSAQCVARATRQMPALQQFLQSY